MATYRGQAIFVSDWRTLSRPLDRNQRAKILFLAEAVERRTKPAGRRNGQLGYVGLAILRAMVFHFMSHRTGLLCPSYDAIQRVTGLCRTSVAAGLARLERCGILHITRRLCRQQVTRTSPLTGEIETIITTVQTSSLYSVHEPGAWAEHLARPVGKRTPFPPKRQLDLLHRMALTWKSRLRLEPSTQPALNPPTRLAQLLTSHKRRG